MTFHHGLIFADLIISVGKNNLFWFMTNIGFVQHTVNLFQEFILHFFPQDIFMNSDSTDIYGVFFQSSVSFITSCPLTKDCTNYLLPYTFQRDSN